MVALEPAMREEGSSMMRVEEASCTSCALNDEKRADCQKLKDATETTDCQPSSRLLGTWLEGLQCSKGVSHAEAAEYLVHRPAYHHH